MRKILLIVSLILGLFLIGSLSGLHFSETNAIPGEVKKIRSLDIEDYGKAVLFEDEFHKLFGVAKTEKKFGFLYRYDGGSAGYSIEDGDPFQAIGMGKKDFIVAVKTPEDSNIKYIALGNHMEGLTPSDTYELSLEDVKQNSEDYHVEEVKDNYILVVLDEYNQDNWTIRAFDKDGNLIADELPGADARYIDWK
jgi:hypothetical protein